MPVETNIEFPDPSMENWRQAAEKALKGADFDETLRSQTLDGLTINPLYERDANATPINRAAPATPWAVIQKMDHVDPTEANSQALDDLMNGASGIAMVFADAHSARGFGMVAEANTFCLLYTSPSPRDS